MGAPQIAAVAQRLRNVARLLQAMAYGLENAAEGSWDPVAGVMDARTEIAALGCDLRAALAARDDEA
jgi:hypothetical protein